MFEVHRETTDRVKGQSRDSNWFKRGLSKFLSSKYHNLWCSLRFFLTKKIVQDTLSYIWIILQSFDFTSDDLHELEEIGRGNYGTVTKMVHKESGTVMAVKVLYSLAVYHLNDWNRESFHFVDLLWDSKWDKLN